MPIGVVFSDDISDEDFGKAFESFQIKETLCKVIDAKETTVNQGLNAALTFELLVCEGEHDGKKAGMERLMFHTAGLLERAFFVLKALGIPEETLRAKGFAITPELVNNRMTRATNKIEKSCGADGCFAKVNVLRKDGEKVIYKCSKCAWEGDEPFEKMAPDYSGYALVEKDSDGKPAAEEDDLSDLAF